MKTTTTRRVLSLAAAAILAGALGGCNANNQGDDASPVFLTVNFTLLPAVKNVNDGSLMQFDTVELKSVLKNPNVTDTRFLDTRIDDYVIEWRRIDGGVTAPATEVFAGNVLVPAGGTSTLTNYPFLSITALTRPPLDKLFPYNGGIDPETKRSEIRCEGKVTWRGHTISGSQVRGDGVFNMTFVYRP